MDTAGRRGSPDAAVAAGLFRAPVPKGPELFSRAPENPILAPTNRWWESVAVLNPGVAQAPDGTIHILYRAVGRDGISRLGYALTRDGVTIAERSPEPVLEPDERDEYDDRGIEDPRITLLGGLYYVTYVGVSSYRPYAATVRTRLKPPDRVRIALATTKDFRTFTRAGVLLPELDNKDAVLFPEKIDGAYVLLHRLPPDVWVAMSPDLRDWTEHRAILRTRPGMWDERKVGAGPAPLRLDEGWLLLYHGSDHHNVYRAGFALLDASDPSVVLGRSEIPVLEPKAPYEMGGKDVAHVVFPTGLVRRGDELLLYYGGADRVIGVARGSLRAVLASLRR